MPNYNPEYFPHAKDSDLAHLLEDLATFKANLEKEIQIQNVFEQKHLSFQSIIRRLKSSNKLF